MRIASADVLYCFGCRSKPVLLGAFMARFGIVHLSIAVFWKIMLFLGTHPFFRPIGLNSSLWPVLPLSLPSLQNAISSGFGLFFLGFFWKKPITIDSFMPQKWNGRTNQACPSSDLRETRQHRTSMAPLAKSSVPPRGSPLSLPNLDLFLSFSAHWTQQNLPLQLDKKTPERRLSLPFYLILKESTKTARWLPQIVGLVPFSLTTGLIGIQYVRLLVPIYLFLTIDKLQVYYEEDFETDKDNKKWYIKPGNVQVNITKMPAICLGMKKKTHFKKFKGRMRLKIKLIWPYDVLRE